MSHRNAWLTCLGRRLLVERVAAGRPVARVAAEMGIPRTERVLTDNPWSYRKGLAWKNALASHWCDRQTHPALPTADQRQGRTLQPHPRRRMGLPAALHLQRRANGSPGKLPAQGAVNRSV